MEKFTIVEAPIKRSKAIKAKQAQAGINEAVMTFKRLSLSSELECVQDYQVGVNALLETLASKLTEAGFAEVIGEAQFATMVENAKVEKATPFSASCQSSAHKQNLIDDGTVPADLWVVEGASVTTAKEDLSSGLALD